MISEEQQDQAALHALGLLPADEADRFERALESDAELRALTRGLQEAAAALAAGLPVATPPPALRTRVLRKVAAEWAAGAPAAETSGGTDARKVVPFRLPAWVPWAVAASLLALCGWLGTERVRLGRELLVASQRMDPSTTTVEPPRPPELPAQLTLFNLAAASPKAPTAARAAVAWDPITQDGVLNVSGLPVPATNQDYQLWAIAVGDKNPVSAGVVKVDAKGVTQLKFRPVSKVMQAAAFAVSLERSGGSSGGPEGPILLAPGS